MAKWKIISTKEMYKNPWIRVREDKVLNQVGRELTYGIVEVVHESVFIVAANASGEVLLLQNYRYHLDKTMWEVPAGYSDGQDPLLAAKRELMEEAGLISDDWTKLSTLYQANGFAKIPFTVFLARNVQAAKGERDKDEDITNHTFFSMDKIEQMAKDGEMIESAHLASVYLGKLHGIKGEN